MDLKLQEVVVAVADLENCPSGDCSCGGHLFLTSFNRGRRDLGLQGSPGSATVSISLVSSSNRKPSSGVIKIDPNRGRLYSQKV